MAISNANLNFYGYNGIKDAAASRTQAGGTTYSGPWGSASQGGIRQDLSIIGCEADAFGGVNMSALRDDCFGTAFSTVSTNQGGRISGPPGISANISSGGSTVATGLGTSGSVYGDISLSSNRHGTNGSAFVSGSSSSTYLG